MNYTINFAELSFILLFSLLLMVISIKSIRIYENKIMVAFLSISYLFYSGVGISYLEDGYFSRIYIFRYFVYFVVLLTTLYVGFEWIFKKEARSKTVQNSESNVMKYIQIWRILSYIFMVTLLVYLLIPTNRISLLWNPPMPSIIDIFERKDALLENPTLVFANSINILLLPCFLIYLKCLATKGKRRNVAIWLFVWVYLLYLKIGYMGRNAILYNALFIYLILAISKHGKVILNKKKVMLLICVIILIVPLLLRYETFRMGSKAGMSNATFKNSFKILFFKETDYPKYYRQIDMATIRPDRKAYLEWLVTFPIPRFVWHNKPSHDLGGLFSSVILGVSKGQKGYNILLPSLLGEGMYMWGSKLYFIDAIILGLYLSFFMSFLERYPAFKYIKIYLLVQTLIIGRAGLASYISQLVNYSFVAIVISLLLNIKTTNKDIVAAS